MPDEEVKMDYGRVMYLAYMIKNDVSGRSGALKEIYEKAVRESDSFRELMALRNGCLFFENGSGESLAKEADRLLEAVFREPGKGPDLLEQMHRLVKGIHREEARSLEVLKACGLTGQRAGVVRKEDAEAYGQMLDLLASVFLFMLLLSGRRSVLGTVRWNREHSLNEKLKLLNEELIRSVLDDQSEMPFWRIVRTGNTERIRFSDSRFGLEWISYQQYLSASREMTVLRDNVYVNPEIEKEVKQGTVYMGMGNIVSCGARECLEHLQQYPLAREEELSTVTRQAAARCREAGLFAAMNAVADGMAYSVSPARAVSLLNQMEEARRILFRKQGGLCLFCGAPSGERLVCPGHLRVEHI